MDKEIISAISYFLHFKYPPTADEIYLFLKKRAKKGEFEAFLGVMVKERRLTKLKLYDRYTLPEYTKYFSIWSKRKGYSNAKKKAKKSYFRFLSFFPQVKLVGISGSVSMGNADEEDDIDVFIIAKKNRLWTARFIAMVLASILGIRRKRNEKHIEDKICLNMFFDEEGLKIPKFKRNEYIAHEILQMKPIINKNEVYGRFIKVNDWMLKIFPNAERSMPNRESQIEKKLTSLLGNLTETVLKRLQLWLINQHKTTEIITDRQLWFFPDDFEKKLKALK